MIPAGAPTEGAFQELLGLLEAGDIVVDGGNSNFRDSQRRHGEAAAKGIRFVDAGVSGGIWGREVGYCLMVGGDDDAVAVVEPAFVTLAPEDGYAHVGPSGAGHFVKMVHNGIEYGLMQAYAEGFEIMRGSEFGLDLHEIAGIWRYGSRRPLVAARARARRLREGRLRPRADPRLRRRLRRGPLDGRRGDRRDVPLRSITAALFARFTSRQEESFAAKVNAALRNQFGGHAIHAVEEPRPRRDRVDVALRSHRGQPAARGAAPQAHARAMRPHDLRRVRRPDRAQALPGAVRARLPAAAPDRFAVVGSPAPR